VPSGAEIEREVAAVEAATHDHRIVFRCPAHPIAAPAITGSLKLSQHRRRSPRPVLAAR
jgi:hypothetical protein